MLRVGLTGGLGSGKSTVGRIFQELGAAVIAADQLGRQLMQPGQAVYSAIVEVFGESVVRADGALDRKVLAELAFQHNRSDALNHIVHPAVVAAEEQWMRGVFAANPHRVAIVESALIFEVKLWGTAPGWAERFDKLILVTVPDEVKISRFVARMMANEDESRSAAFQVDARARLAAQISDKKKTPYCDYVVDNTGPLSDTRVAVERIYGELVQAARESS